MKKESKPRNLILPKFFLKQNAQKSVLDNNLTLSAKGLMWVMANMPAKYNYNISKISQTTNVTPLTVSRLLKELQDNGYLNFRKREINGIVNWEFIEKGRVSNDNF